MKLGLILKKLGKSLVKSLKLSLYKYTSYVNVKDENHGLFYYFYTNYFVL